MEKSIKNYLIAGITMIAVVFTLFGFTGMAISEEQKEDVYYTCPMESHSDVAMGEPGDCPKCGMKLVPKKMEGMKFTCPMEEHADVVEDRPGECPKCGMKLVPKKS